MSVEHHVVLVVTQRLAVSDANLFAHQVNAGNFLADRMFDLKTCIDLEEIEVARFVVQQEFNRAHGVISERTSDVERGRRHCFSEDFVNTR